MPESPRSTDTFRASWRNKHSELKHLTDGEFRLLEFYIDKAYWDDTKADFGKVVLTDKKVAEQLGCDASTVWRHREGLINKGELKMEGNKKVIPNFERYRYPYDHFKKPAELQDGLADLQEEDANLQVSKDLTSSNPASISRYKDSFKDKFNKEDWRDCLIDRKMAKEPCFCRSGKSLEDCCGPLVHESLRHSEEMVEIRRKGRNE